MAAPCNNKNKDILQQYFSTILSGSRSNVSPNLQNDAGSLHDFTAKFSCDEFLYAVVNTDLTDDNLFVLIYTVVIGVDNAWLFPVVPNDLSSEHESIIKERTKQFDALINRLYMVATVPVFTDREDIGYEREDFPGVISRAVNVMKLFGNLLNRLHILSGIEHSKCCQVHHEELLQTISIRSLLLTSEHIDSKLAWSDAGSCQESQQLISSICVVNKCKGMQDFLKTSGGLEVLKSYFVEVQPKLKKTTWKNCPATSQSFCHVLTHATRPNIGDYLPQILPPTLLFLDDFQMENKLLGLRCISHVIEHTSKAELRCLGRLDVIYDTLQKLLYSNEPVLLDSLFPVLVATLDVYEQNTAALHEYNRTDEVLHRYLRDAEMWSNSAPLRRVYARHLSSLLSLAGIRTVRHSKRFMTLIDTYLGCYAGEQEEEIRTKVDVMVALKTFITVAWPRVSHHENALAKTLLRTIYDISSAKPSTSSYHSESSRIESALLSHAGECLVLISKLSTSGEIKNSVDALLELDLGPEFHTHLNSVYCSQL